MTTKSNSASRAIVVGKADPLGGVPVPAMYLSVAGKMPPWPGDVVSLKEAFARRHALFAAEAAKIIDVLASLPGGTWDALLIAMLTRHRSVLSVPFRKPKKKRK